MLREFFAIALLMTLDCVWIALNQKNYNGLVKLVQGSDLKLNLNGAVAAYLVMGFALYLIVFKNIERDKNTKDVVVLALKHGAALGFVIYGVYNATNLAIFRNYQASSMYLIDTLWGTFAFFFATWVTLVTWAQYKSS